MRFSIFSTPRRPLRSLLSIAFLWAASPHSFAQTNVLGVTSDKVTAKIGAATQAKLSVHLRPGYHANSNTPSDAYLIPLRLTWNAGPLDATQVSYPKPQMEKYSFSEAPLSVFSGDFDIVTTIKTPPTAKIGPTALTGKLRYQACNDHMCLAPKTVDVSLQVDLVK